jgi:hypothetical protein
VRTLVISDLHLGKSGRTDLLRRPELRAPLIDALAGVDRLVILGDGLELRELPERDAAAVAAPLLREAGRALGPDGELLIVAGNHDHALAGAWLDARLRGEPSGFLELETRYAPIGPLANALAAAAAPARVSFAYPGVWLREDVYALHGHYADLHATIPTVERIVAGAMARFATRQPPERAVPDDYEAALAPIYSWIGTLVQRAEHAVVNAGAGASTRSWAALTGRERPLRAATLRAGFAAAVAALNAAGLGPLERGLSPAALRRGYLHGIREVTRRLGVDGAGHVLWGHSHRAGPWPGDDPAEWVAAGGARIHNAGSWVYQPHFLGPDADGSPYWPGSAILVEDSGPPRLLRLLGDRGHAELRPRPS